jgi:hypothetical protein
MDRATGQRLNDVLALSEEALDLTSKTPQKYISAAFIMLPLIYITITQNKMVEAMRLIPELLTATSIATILPRDLTELLQNAHTAWESQDLEEAQQLIENACILARGYNYL